MLAQQPDQRLLLPLVPHRLDEPLVQHVGGDVLVVVPVPLDQPVGAALMTGIVRAIGASADVVGEFLAPIGVGPLPKRRERGDFPVQDVQLPGTLDAVRQAHDLLGAVVGLEGAGGILESHARIAEQDQGLRKGDVVAAVDGFGSGDPILGPGRGVEELAALQLFAQARLQFCRGDGFGLRDIGVHGVRAENQDRARRKQ